MKSKWKLKQQQKILRIKIRQLTMMMMKRKLGKSMIKKANRLYMKERCLEEKDMVMAKSLIQQGN